MGNGKTYLTYKEANKMRKVKIEYLDGRIDSEECDFLYIDLLQKVKSIDDVPLPFYAMTEDEIRNELKRIGMSEGSILYHINQLPNPRPDLGENNLLKDKLYRYERTR